MTTGNDIVTSALQRIGVTGIGRAPSGEDMTASLRELNFMLEGWKAEGIDLEQATVDAGTVLTTDTKYDETISMCLAMRLAPFYSVQVQFARDAMRGLKVLSAAYHELPTVALDPILTRMPSQRSFAGN